MIKEENNEGLMNSSQKDFIIQNNISNERPIVDNLNRDVANSCETFQKCPSKQGRIIVKIQDCNSQ